MGATFIRVSDRPDLAPVVAGWRIGAFGLPGGWTVEDLTALILARPAGREETFVLLDGDRPVGTASPEREDLEARPDLSPWLAGVYVEPAFRGRGYATALVRRVEAFAREASVPVCRRDGCGRPSAWRSGPRGRSARPTPRSTAACPCACGRAG